MWCGGELIEFDKLHVLLCNSSSYLCRAHGPITTQWLKTMTSCSQNVVVCLTLARVTVYSTYENKTRRKIKIIWKWQGTIRSYKFGGCG